MCNYLLKMYQGERKESWQPCENLLSKYKNTNYAILILNTSLKFHPTMLLNLWTQAKVRITVDGGTDRWLSWLKVNNLDFNKLCPPDLITGDMDSLSSDTMEYFINSNSCKVIRTPDQNETDFTKALRELSKYCAARSIQVDTVYVISETSGRLDQILANINTLHKAYSILPRAKVFQVASNSLTWLLLDGSHTIDIPESLRESQEWCALMPFKCPVNVSTTGLKWNLNNAKMEFGALVSTSNTYDGSSTVTIHTDGKLVWSMGIESLSLNE